MTNFSHPGVSDTYTERTTLGDYGFGGNETPDGGAPVDPPTDVESDDSDSRPGDSGDCIAISDSTGEACSNARSYMTDGPFCTPHDNAADVETIYQLDRLLGIVGCGNSKVELEDAETCPIGELYDSGYFGDKWDWAGAFCDQRFVLSAEHGLVPEGTEVEYYDTEIGDHSEGEREAWLADVESSLQDCLDEGGFDRVVVLASQHYVEVFTEAADVLLDADIPVHEPFWFTTGLPHQRRWMLDAIEAGRPMLDSDEIEGRDES